MRKLVATLITLILVSLIFIPLANSENLKNKQSSYESSLSIVDDYPDFVWVGLEMVFYDGEYIPVQIDKAINKGIDYEGDTPILLAYFIDDDDYPSRVVEFNTGYWPCNEEIRSGDWTYWDNFPSDFEKHDVTIIMDYKRGTRLYDYLHRGENGNVYEGDLGERNNFDFTWVQDWRGSIKGVIEDSKDNLIEGLDVRVNGIDNDYEEKQTTPYNESLSFWFRGIPNGKYNVTVEDNGKILKSQEVEVPVGDNSKYITFNVDKRKSKDIRFSNFILDKLPIFKLIIKFLSLK